MTRILLVEDHEEIWDFLSRRLKRRGFEVILAHDGQDGVDKARASNPDIVLLDMNLPVMDGWTAARTMRADTSMPRMPIIALTAHAMSGDREKTLAAGCDDYHAKPVDFSKLLAQIDALLPAGAAAEATPS
ncbi:response regulator [Aurantimonas sp. Leaf443]|uniref:response regulator n=1 Tax=Aurantimonas sp. Leaf443 TaxID=1736378 RepID=UPI0006F5CC08|nr:response regulator [Aurantimonas sp. Leaf443]KQT83799.1 two-component system response regulator [Aurantimonas sp. Leaf443]